MLVADLLSGLGRRLRSRNNARRHRRRSNHLSQVAAEVSLLEPRAAFSRARGSRSLITVNWLWVITVRSSPKLNPATPSLSTSPVINGTQITIGARIADRTSTTSCGRRPTRWSSQTGCT